MLKLRTWTPVTYQGQGFTLTMELKRLPFVEEKSFAVHYNRIRRGRLNRALMLAMAEERQRKAWLVRRGNAQLEAASLPTVAVGEDLDAALGAIASAREAAGLPETPLTPDELRELMPDPVASREQEAEQEAAFAEYMDSLDAEWLAGVFARYVNNVAGLEIDGEPVRTGEALLAVADGPLIFFVIETVRELAGLSESEKKASSSPSTSEPAAGMDAGESPATSAGLDAGMAPATAPAMPADAPSSSVSLEATAGSLA